MTVERPQQLSSGSRSRKRPSVTANRGPAFFKQGGVDERKMMIQDPVDLILVELVLQVNQLTPLRQRETAPTRKLRIPRAVLHYHPQDEHHVFELRGSVPGKRPRRFPDIK